MELENEFHLVNFTAALKFSYFVIKTDKFLNFYLVTNKVYGTQCLQIQFFAVMPRTLT